MSIFLTFVLVAAVVLAACLIRWLIISHRKLTPLGYAVLATLLIICVISGIAYYHFVYYASQPARTRSERVAYSPKRQHKRKPKANPVMRKRVNYRQSSEVKPYPRKLSKADQIVVSTRQQRAFIQVPVHHGNSKDYRTVYTMYVSTGSHNRMPKGAYHINAVRSPWFYSSSEREGAAFGTGWHDGGTYLFHATPANQKHQIFKKVAKDLGKRPSSHGCIHLTVPDAKWFYGHAVTGMKVFIN